VKRAPTAVIKKFLIFDIFYVTGPPQNY